MRKSVSSAVLAGASMFIFGGLAALAPSAGAVVLHYCLANYLDPNPCPPPDHPEPIDQGCLRVDIEPLRCPYLP